MSVEANDVSNDIDVEESDKDGLYYYSIGWFACLLVALFIFQRTTQSASQERKSPAVTADFKQFQYKYLTVFLIMMGADWLQGPYVYALYKHYGFDMSDIGILFLVGFGSSLLFGTIVGSMADKYGRKLVCLLFALFYGLSCITKHFGNYNVLLTGRLLAGISTSILFSSFESWMVHEHHEKGYPEEWLGLTFAICTSGNGIIAILSGVVASVARDNFGPVAPFDVSLILLVIGGIYILMNWTENTGDAHSGFGVNFTTAYTKLKQDRRIALLGCIQSFFEGAMYIFVFMWTPALESTTVFPIHHGWIFACFMICVLIGSHLFGYLLERGYSVEKSAMMMFITAAFSLVVPAFLQVHSIRLVSFFVFEICVGLFWPSMGFLRGRYVPEEVRSTVMNFFRIPLNLIVVIVLYNIGDMSELTVFLCCFGCLLMSLLCQYNLVKLTDDAAVKPADTDLPLQEVTH